MSTGRDGDKGGRDREQRASYKEWKEKKKRERKQRVALVRLRPSGLRDGTGKEPDTRRDTRTLVHCGMLASCTSITPG